jgi:hypothetical protein
MSALTIPSKPLTKPARKYQVNSDGEFVCPHCIYTARHMSTMHYHLKKHSGVTDYICTSCNKQFLQKQTLELHIHARHPEMVQMQAQTTIKFRDLKAAKEAGQALPGTTTSSIKTHTCPVKGCEFSSLSKGNCRIHCMRIHYAEYSNEHIVRGEGGTCTCALCDEEFKSLTHAYYHMAACLTECQILPAEDASFITTHVL